jgi:hypothetical protein
MDVAIVTFNSIAEDGFSIDYTKADSIPVYLENWRMKIWDIGFPEIFRRSTFEKGDDFAKHSDASSLVNRIIYRFVPKPLILSIYFIFSSLLLKSHVIELLILCRYFMFELVPKKAISKDDLPPNVSLKFVDLREIEEL